MRVTAGYFSPLVLFLQTLLILWVKRKKDAISKCGGAICSRQMLRRSLIFLCTLLHVQKKICMMAH